MLMLETLFLISLGITFILILLLIYHFKNRLAAAEQKHDVLLEILNTLVQETHMLKSVVGTLLRPMPLFTPPIHETFRVVEEERVEEEFEELEDLEDDLEDDLEEVKDEIVVEESLEIHDFQKMKLSTLRELVTQRGLVTDASKLKKPQLVELLHQNMGI